jgi:hypothetical protein
MGSGTVTRRLVTVTAIALSVVVLTATACSRDEGSYQYGRSTLSTDAGMLLSTSGPGSAVHSAEDACGIVIDASMRTNTAQADSMRKLDRDDMLAGCTDAVNGK